MFSEGFIERGTLAMQRQGRLPLREFLFDITPPMSTKMARVALRHPSLALARSFSRALTTSCACPPGKALLFDRHGNPEEVLKLVDLPGASLKEKEVCVRMLAAPINPSDINRIEGVYPVGPPVPAVGGNEGVGEVIAVADGVKSLSVNDWVIPAKAGLGTWRNYVVKEETDWCKVRSDVPVEYAATVFINPCTALRMLEDFVPLSKGDLVVQNGATSIVGQCVIQLAHLRGLQTLNIIRERPDLQVVKKRLESLGASGIFTESEASSKDLLGDLKDSKLGLNCVGGNAATAVMKLLRENGTMVTYGGMAKKPIMVSTSAMIFKGIELKGFWLQKWMSRHSPADLARMTDYLLGLVHEGKLSYLMEKAPFSEFNIAMEKALGKHGSAMKQVLTFT